MGGGPVRSPGGSEDLARVLMSGAGEAQGASTGIGLSREAGLEARSLFYE